MNREIFLSFIIIMIFSVGCGNTETINTRQNAEQAITGNDYSQYIKKTWILNKDSEKALGEGYISIRISTIDNNGQIKGRLYSDGFVEISDETVNLESVFNGTLHDDVAECKFKTSKGNIGIMKLLFFSSDELQVTLSSVSKKDSSVTSPELIFELEPDNINKMEEFRVIENQSYMVDLDSWGKVRFVVGNLLGGSYEPVLSLYITNEAGDILYDFFNMYAGDTASELYYAKYVDDVSFEDVNRDGLKDFVIIATTKKDKEIKHSGEKIASVYLQNAEGEFMLNYKLEKEINNSFKDKDIKSVVSFLVKKFNS